MDETMAEKKDCYENAISHGLTEKGKVVKERETWRTNFDFFLSLIGSSVGLGNVWRFPYLCYKNGGGAFLIPYFISVIVCGVPLLLLEIGVGQFMGEGLIGAYGRLCPLMQGVGIGMTMVELYMSIYYNVIMAWALFYLFASFSAQLPWASCGNDWNTRNCRIASKQTENVFNDTVTSPRNHREYNFTSEKNFTLDDSLRSSDPASEYWTNRVLHITGGVDDVGEVRWELALCLLLAWVLVYVCICKGIKSSGRVMYVTATTPFILLLILVIRGVTLPGAAQGIQFYLLPDWSKLLDPQVWTDAGTQVFFSYSVGHAVLTSLGSYNKYNHNVFRDAVGYCAVNTLTSFLSGFVIFPVLGYMALQNDIDIAEVASSGPGLAFIAYPKALAELPVAPVWSVLFFLCLLLLGLDSEFVGVESFCTSIIDTWPHITRRGYRKEALIAVTCLIMFLIGLSMVTEGGMYIFLMFDFYMGSRILLVMCLAELIAVSYIYGVRRYADNFEMMLGFRLGPYMLVCWAAATPMFVIMLLALVCYNMDELTYNNTYEYPFWCVLIGWAMMISCIIVIPLVAILKLFSTRGSVTKRFRILTRPRLRAHQLRPCDDPKDLLPNIDGGSANEDFSPTAFKSADFIKDKMTLRDYDETKQLFNNNETMLLKTNHFTKV